MASVIIHYQEIALKGRNRPWFVERLLHNLRVATSDLGVQHVRTMMGRIELVLHDDSDWATLRERLSTTFGIANFSKAVHTSSNLDTLGERILADLGDRSPESFAVAARRADKRYPISSPEIEQRIGARIKMARGWRVDLSQPALTVHVEVLRDHAFYYFDKQRGPGGLPIGVGGRVACLMSGGIDSPVAAWRMMRRGCRVLFVHFHSYPILSRASQEKARELARLLTRFQFHSRLFLVPFGDLQQRIVLSVPPPLRVVMYRRLMLRIAERIARQERAQALITGEVVGQVASQTLENLAIIDSVASLPLLRPLIGMDKEEITMEAQRLGTYPISIIPDQDCCTLFTPRHPATKARRIDVEHAEAALAIDEMIAGAVDATSIETFTFPGSRRALAGASSR
jgi:thiamine biosynthesis protein ThiI